MRAVDESIPPDEKLYRSVSSADVIGEDVLPSAVDLPRCSFDREKYCESPTSVLTDRRRGDTGVLSITSSELPEPVPRLPPSNGAPYEFFAVDDPYPPEDPNNKAHAEVRMKPVGATFSKNHKPPKPVLAKAKDALARRLRIVIPPRC
jgi:hypothetical protein